MLKHICILMLAAFSLAFYITDLDLPDPLTATNGQKVKTINQWHSKRRAEILKLFRTYVYGQTPLGRPDNMTFEVLETNTKALNSVATRKQIRIHLHESFNELHMDILIYLPNGIPHPVKMFIGLNFRGNHAIHVDPNILETNNYTPWEHAARGEQSRRWPVEQILRRGYGLATIHCADIDPDRDDDFKDGVHGAFDPLYYPQQRPDDAWGTIGAWAWGLSRAMDYFETDVDIDHTQVAVLGHSRLGKTALWCGAQDERFALVISNDSGCTGAALAHRKMGEKIVDINRGFPHWFCKNYKNFNDREEELPVDQHMLIALMAPRPVYVASATEDQWADPEGEFLSCVYAAPVYSLFSLAGLGTDQMPAPDNSLNSGYIGYHIRTGKHDMITYDWNCFMDFADKHFN